MAESLTKGGFTLAPKAGTGNAQVSVSCSERTGRVDTSPVTFTAKMDGFSVSKSVSVVQKGKAEFVHIGKTAYAVNKEGEVVTVEGISNSPKLIFSFSDTTIEVNNYTANGAAAVNGEAIAGDPGASAQYAFSIPVTIPENVAAVTEKYTMTVKTESGETAEVSFVQGASAFTYKLIPIASVPIIPASGGSSTITATLETYRNGNKIDSNEVYPTHCTIPEGTAFTVNNTVAPPTISAPSRGTTVGDERSVTVTVRVEDQYGRYDVSSDIVISQEKNEITNYGDVHFGVGGLYPEDGNPTEAGSEYTFDAVPTVKCILFADFHQEITYTSGDTRNGSITYTKDIVTPCDAFSVDMDSDEKTMLISTNENKSESKLGPLVAKITGLGEGDKSDSLSGTVYQAAGVKTYAYPVISIAPFADIPAMGGSITPHVTYSQTWGWNGATTGGGTLTTGGTVTFSNGTTDGKVSAESLSTTLKDRSSVATVTVTVSMNGKSIPQQYTVYQAANIRRLLENTGAFHYGEPIGADGSATMPIVIDSPCYWAYSSTRTELISKESLSISYAKNWGGGSEYNNATLNTSNGYVTADSLGTTTKEKTLVLKVQITYSIDGQSVSNVASVYQAANQVESSTTTGGETIYNAVTAGAISSKTIPASGGSATATAGDGSQSWTTNTKYRHDTYTSGSVADILIEDSKIGTDTIAPSVASISGSAESKGTTESGVTTVKEQAVTWTGNGGKSATGTMYIYQEANEKTSITYGLPVINSFTVDDIPASGGSISSGSVSYYQPRVQNYTSGANSQLSALDSGGIITYSTAVSADSLGTTANPRTDVGTLTATVTMNGRSGSKEVTVYQAANSVTYGTVSVSATTPVSIPAAGAIYNIKPTTSQTVYFTSGSTRAGSIDLSYVAKNTVTGFSNSGETVTVQQNLTTSPRNGFIVTVTATGEGSESDSVDVTFNQAAAAAYLTVDPSTINLAADETSASFNISSNDSWTIS